MITNVYFLCFAGKYNPEKAEYKRWKTNFRCALNSLHDVEVVKEKCNTKSKEPYKVYHLLPMKLIKKSVFIIFLTFHL